MNDISEINNMSKTLADLLAKMPEAQNRHERFVDEPDFLQEHFVMIHGTDCVWDGFAGRMMKASHLQKSAPVGYKLWQSNPGRKVVDVDDVVFDPAGTCGDGIINLYRGIKMKPKTGDCELIKDLLLTLCNGDKELCKWITCWIAYPLQNIGAKMQTSVVMRGWKNGTGKNLFWEDVVLHIYGLYGQAIDQQDVEGSYNGWASSKLFIVADEVVSPSEKWHIKGALKRMITGKTIRISEKYLPTRTEKNHCNFVFLSNENVPLPVDSDDRRYTVVEPSIKRNPEYYASIGKQIETGGVEAFYDYLLSIDLSEFNAHSKPFENADKREIIELSMRSHERFVYEWINQTSPFDLEPVTGEAIFLAYQVWCKQNGERATNLNTLARELRKHTNTDRKTHPATHEKKSLYIPKGWVSPLNWQQIDDFYEKMRNAAEYEARIKL